MRNNINGAFDHTLETSGFFEIGFVITLLDLLMRLEEITGSVHLILEVLKSLIEFGIGSLLYPHEPAIEIKGGVVDDHTREGINKLWLQLVIFAQLY
jgi:hypothetical protein